MGYFDSNPYILKCLHPLTEHFANTDSIIDATRAWRTGTTAGVCYRRVVVQVTVGNAGITPSLTHMIVTYR